MFTRSFLVGLFIPYVANEPWHSKINIRNKTLGECINSSRKSVLHEKNILPFKLRHVGLDGLLLCYGKSLDRYRYKSQDSFIVAGNNLAFRAGIPLNYLFSGVAGYGHKKNGQKRDDTSYGPNRKSIDKYRCIIQKFYIKRIGARAAKQGNALLYETQEDVEFQRDVGHHPFGQRGSGTHVHVVAQFLLYTGVRSLTLVGCDASNNGYSRKIHFKKKGRQRFKNMYPQWERFKLFMESCYPEVNVSVINPVGLKGIGWKEIVT